MIISSSCAEFFCKKTYNVHLLSQTFGHNWSVYVNRVAHDAAVKSTLHRCVAGGYRWNPYFVHLADPNNVCKCECKFLSGGVQKLTDNTGILISGGILSTRMLP